MSDIKRDYYNLTQLNLFSFIPEDRYKGQTLENVNNSSIKRNPKYEEFIAKYGNTSKCRDFILQYCVEQL